MNTKLNLASKPFSNRTLPWVITSLITILSVASFIFIVKATGDTNAQSAQLQRDIRSFKEEQDAIQKKADVVKESMTAEQLASLRAAHELVDRKRFSWSRLFIDLENALPGSVRVTRISVRDVATQGEQTVAELDLAVVAKSAATITDMISEMDRGGVFQAELRSQNLQKGRGETGTEYELIVEYRPGAGAPVSDAQASNLVTSQRPDLMEEKR